MLREEQVDKILKAPLQLLSKLKKNLDNSSHFSIKVLEDCVRIGQYLNEEFKLQGILVINNSKFKLILVILNSKFYVTKKVFKSLCYLLINCQNILSYPWLFS